MHNPKQLVLAPHISEQTYALSEKLNTYVFEVPSIANKLMVKEAVEAQYGVSVESVNITVIKGKVKKSPRRRKQPVDGKRKDLKKAFVKVKKGDKIAIFEEVA